MFCARLRNQYELSVGVLCHIQLTLVLRGATYRPTSQLRAAQGHSHLACSATQGLAAQQLQFANHFCATSAIRILSFYACAAASCHLRAL